MEVKTENERSKEGGRKRKKKAETRGNKWQVFEVGTACHRWNFVS